jgi:hypothetical protein
MKNILICGFLSFVGIVICMSENIALHKKYKLDPKPNYPLTRKDGTDLVDLTDGKLVKSSRLWYFKEAVGWGWKYNKVRILMDLGKEYPVREARLHLQGGSEQYSISFPQSVQILASNDNKHFFPIEKFSRDKDRKSYDVPITKGKSWTHWLTFKNINLKCRYILFVIKNGGQLVLCDEIEIIRGHKGAKAVNRGSKSVIIKDVEFYFPRSSFNVCRNLPLPGYFSCLDTRKNASEKVNLEIITPSGVVVEAGVFGPKVLYSKRSFIKGINSGFKRSKDSAGNNVLAFSTKTKTKKSWGRFFLQFKRNYTPKASDKIIIAAKWNNNTSRTEVPLKTFKADDLRTVSSQIINGINFDRRYIELWPDVLTSFRKLGFNTFYAFGNASTVRGKQLDLINKARKNGFIIAYFDSPFFKFHNLRWQKGKEIFCQLGGNKYSNTLCPSYKGKYYDAELERIAENCRRCNASIVFFDTELWGSGGPIKHGASKCSRCQKAKQRSNFKTWDELFEYMGFQMLQDIRIKIRNKVRQNKLQVGSYEIGPLFQNGFYQHSWRFSKLYPEILQFAQPCYYSSLMDYNLKELNEKLSKVRAKLSANTLVPWLTPGDFGEFESEKLEDALNICFVNGSIGVNWWSSRCWDPDDVVRVAKCFSNLAGMEKVIKNGRKSNILSSDDKNQKLHSLKYQKTILLGAWSYKSKLTKYILVRSSRKILSVTELHSGKKIPVSRDKKSFAISFARKRNILFRLDLL